MDQICLDSGNSASSGFMCQNINCYMNCIILLPDPHRKTSHLLSSLLKSIYQVSDMSIVFHMSTNSSETEFVVNSQHPRIISYYQRLCMVYYSERELVSNLLTRAIVNAMVCMYTNLYLPAEYAAVCRHCFPFQPTSP